jgi:hypothetical protein
MYVYVYCVVPLSVSGADLLEKVLWLKENEKLAKILATNARNFGQFFYILSF